MLSHPIQHRARADDELGQKARPGIRTEHYAQAGVDWSCAVLRVLCDFRLAVEPGHVEGESARVDEQDCYVCRDYWHVFNCYERGVEFIVSCETTELWAKI